MDEGVGAALEEVKIKLRRGGPGLCKTMGPSNT